MRSLEGAACADLPPQVVDKYFDCHVGVEPFLARTAKAICSHCVVQEPCLQAALTMPNLPGRGVIGGMNVAEIERARRWRDYEQGCTEQVPRRPRPDWLPMTEATQQVEQLRLDADPDEPPD